MRYPKKRDNRKEEKERIMVVFLENPDSLEVERWARQMGVRYMKKTTGNGTVIEKRWR